MAEADKGHSRLAGVVLAVCVAAAVTGAALGLFTEVLYRLDSRANPHYGLPGLWLGGGSGLVCAAVWCIVMGRLASRTGRRVRRPVALGTLAGAVAGCFSASVVHVGVMFLLGVPELFPALLLVFVFGLPAGAMVGVLGGWLWRRAMPGGEDAVGGETGP